MTCENYFYLSTETGKKTIKTFGPLRYNILLSFQWIMAKRRPRPMEEIMTPVLSIEDSSTPDVEDVSDTEKHSMTIKLSAILK